MSKPLRQSATGTESELIPGAIPGQPAPTPEQRSFPFNAASRLHSAIDQGYALMSQASHLLGGLKVLASELQRPAEYASKLSEGITRYRGSHARLEWVIAAALANREVAYLFACWFAELAHCDPPPRRREVTDADVSAALRKVVRDMPVHMRDGFEAGIAQALGVRRDAVRL